MELRQTFPEAITEGAACDSFAQMHSGTCLAGREAIDPPDQSHETIWEEFLRLQLKPCTRQEYRKSIDYFCRFGLANAARSMTPEESPANFLSEFLALSKSAAIHLVLEWRQHQMNEGKASATISLRLKSMWVMGTSI